MKPADVIVILSGEKTERLDYGVKLFREGWARKDKIILTGGTVVWKYTYASLMQEHALYLGVPKKDILLEDKSESTKENALFTKEILKRHGYTSLILVTSPYHSKQGEKFDPHGHYVRKWCPEIAKLADKWLHQPHTAPAEILRAAEVELGHNYPLPVVSHAISREVALEAFPEIRGGQGGKGGPQNHA